MIGRKVDRALETLFRPRSVAVIGATEDHRTFAGAPLHNLLAHGFDGRVYPVNPRRPQVQGVRAYPSVSEVPESIDTAIIAVPSAAVLEVLRQAIAKGASSATIVSSGFGEEAAGQEGKARHAELEELIRRTGVRVLGPNTTGLANLVDGYVPRAAFNQLDPEHMKPGRTALVTQSGACGNIIFNAAQASSVHIGLSVATGDQIDIDLWEVCGHVLEDERFDTLLVVAETFGQPARLERVALRAAELGKLVAVLKLGRSEAGSRAVLTHSGSLAGDAAVQSAALRQLGLYEVEDLEDLWRLAQMVQAWGFPGEQDGRLGVISLSGGEAALIADQCSAYGIELPPCTATFAEFIKQNFEYAMASNPFDPSGEITGRPEKLRVAVRGFLEQNSFSEVLFASPVLRNEQAERQLSEVPAFSEDPHPNTCFSYWPAGTLTDRQSEILRGTGQPVFEGSGRAVRALYHYRGAGRRRRHIAIRTGPAETEGRVEADVRYYGLREELASLGIPFPPARLARSPGELAVACAELGFPLVLKANVLSSVHKLANGLVALDISSPEEAAEAFSALDAAGQRFAADGVVAERRGRGSLEALVGMTREPLFGATVLFGRGGSTVEYDNDSAVAVARYLDESESASLISATRIGAYLVATAPEAADAIARALKTVVGFFDRNPHLEGLDLNPLLVDIPTREVTCVDARVA